MEDEIQRLYLHDVHNYDNCKLLIDKYGYSILWHTCMIQTINDDTDNGLKYFDIKSNYCSPASDELLLAALTDQQATPYNILCEIASKPYYETENCYSGHLIQLHNLIFQNQQDTIDDLTNKILQMNP